MDADAKKTALRMIPYGLYVLTSEGGDGRVGAATVNWVTQTAFEPPLVAVGVKADSNTHALIKDSGTFALNVLGRGQQHVAFTFFKPLEREGDTIGGQPFTAGKNGAPLLSMEDEKARPRVNMTMDFDGAPKIEFLREDGAASHRLP